jgi:hypothetical protein
MAGGALATGDDQAGNENRTRHSPDNSAQGGIARSKSSGA